MTDWMTIEETAKYMNLSTGTTERLIETKALVACRIEGKTAIHIDDVKKTLADIKRTDALRRAAIQCVLSADAQDRGPMLLSA